MLKPDKRESNKKEKNDNAEPVMVELSVDDLDKVTGGVDTLSGIRPGLKNTAGF